MCFISFYQFPKWPALFKLFPIQCSPWRVFGWSHATQVKIAAPARAPLKIAAAPLKKSLPSRQSQNVTFCIYLCLCHCPNIWLSKCVQKVHTCMYSLTISIHWITNPYFYLGFAWPCHSWKNIIKFLDLGNKWPQHWIYHIEPFFEEDMSSRCLHTLEAAIVKSQMMILMH